MKFKDFEALVNLDLLEIVGMSERSQREQEEYLKNFDKLVIAVEAGQNNRILENGYLDKIRRKDKEYEGIVTSAVLAKQLAISQYLGKLKYILEALEKNRRNQAESELDQLIGYVSNNYWVSFSKNSSNLNKIRAFIKNG